MNEIKAVGFSSGMMMLLNGCKAKAGQAQFDKAIQALANQVSGLEHGRFAIDSMDSFAWFNGVPLSFLRNWNTGEALVMTTKEANGPDEVKAVYGVVLDESMLSVKTGWRS